MRVGASQGIDWLVVIGSRGDELRGLLELTSHVSLDIVEISGHTVGARTWVFVRLELMSHFLGEGLGFFAAIKVHARRMLLRTRIFDMILFIQFRTVTRKGDNFLL